MPPDERVSVLMPYRDAAATLIEAAESILSEREVPLELIAIDDGSRDEGPELVRALGARDARVRTVASDGVGIACALERGRTEARGAWIARMDADDMSLPGRLVKQRDALRARPRAGAIGARVVPFGDVGEGMRRYLEWQNALVTEEEHARDLFVESPLCHPSVMLRTEALTAVGGWRDRGWPEDYDLWLRLDAAGWELAKVPEVLLRWRRHPSAATFTRPEYSLAAMCSLRAAFLAPKLRRRARPLAVWGAGRTGRRLARALEPHGVRAALFVDIDPRKIGRIARGVPIAAPDALVRGAHMVVVAVGARGARSEVREHLVSRGFVEGEDFVCAA